MTTLDPRFVDLLSHLHRGGDYMHFWKKGQGSSWWNGDGPPNPPATADLYFGVHPAHSIPTTDKDGNAAPPENVRSRDEFIAAINCLPADFDGKLYGGKANALAHVEKLEPAPSVIVDSGGGYHCYWLLAQPWALPDDAERARVKALQERWAAHVGGDPAAAKLPQLLRVPGTDNTKYDPPAPVELLRCDLGLVYDLGELVALLPPVPVQAPRPAGPSITLPPLEVPTGTGWEATQRRAAALRVREWLERKVGTITEQMGHAGDGTRHTARLKLGKLAGGLVAAGLLSDEDAFTLVYDAQPPGRDDKKERKAIADGIAEGTRHPFTADDLPRIPTDKALIARDGRAYCPACATEAKRSGYPYPGTQEPGWYCPRCKGVMVWPLEAFTPAGLNGIAEPIIGERGRAGGKLVHASRLGEVVEKITWLIPGVLGLNSISQLFGAPGSGKSLLALDQALCVAQQAPVIYIAAEAAGEQEERVAAWCTHHGLGTGELYFWPSPLVLKDPASVDAFIAEALTIRPALIALDPLAACMVGLEESSTGDMTIAVDALNRIRAATGAALNVVHHTGWDERHERGNSSLRAACRVVVKLSTDDTGLMTLTSEKANNGKPFDARYFKLVQAGESVAPIPASKATTQGSTALTVKHIDILAALALRQHADGASFSQILDHTGQGKSTLNYGISRLLERGLIARERQTYSLTNAGREALERANQAHEHTSSVFRTSTELALNWTVESPIQSSDLPHQGAEFSQFSPDHENPAPVQSVQDGAVQPQFSGDTASERASSVQFSASSVSSSVDQFSSSVSARSLERDTTEPIEPNDPEGWLAGDEADTALTPLSEAEPAEVGSDEPLVHRAPPFGYKVWYSKPVNKWVAWHGLQWVGQADTEAEAIALAWAAGRTYSEADDGNG